MLYSMEYNKTKIFLLSVFLTVVSCCSSQIIKRQVRIPLNNLSGVPYYISNDVDTHPAGINGFEIDTAGNYYFMAGDKQKGTTTLAVFKGNKQMYRKTYKTYFASKLCINNDKLYLIDISHVSYPPK